jgi:hypothetical protein
MPKIIEAEIEDNETNITISATHGQTSFWLTVEGKNNMINIEEVDAVIRLLRAAKKIMTESNEIELEEIAE